MRRLIPLTGLILAVGVLLPGTALEARDAATGVAVTPVSGQVVADEIQWIDEGTEKWSGAPLSTPVGDVPGTVFQKRDMVLGLPVIGSDYIAGFHTSMFGYNLNLRTWHGAGFGTVRIDPAMYSPDGWFDCSQTYVYAGGFPPAWSGLMVCHGQGTLDGVQLRLGMEHDSLTFETTYDGYAFTTGS